MTRGSAHLCLSDASLEEFEGLDPTHLRSRLSSCPACCQRYARLQEQRSLLWNLKRQGPAASAPDLWDRLRSRLESTRPPG